MSTKIQWIQEEIEGLKAGGLYNRIRTLSSPQGAWLVVDGKRVLNFCSNNYLGLANHPRLVQAAQEAALRIWHWPGGSALHRRHDGPAPGAGAAPGRFQGRRKPPSPSSPGFCANLATIPALVGKEDVIFSDELNHASIIDGAASPAPASSATTTASPVDLEKRSLRRPRAPTAGP